MFGRSAFDTVCFIQERVSGVGHTANICDLTGRIRVTVTNWCQVSAWGGRFGVMVGCETRHGCLNWTL